MQRSGGAPARHAVAVIGAETTEIVLGQGVAVTLAVSSAHESGHHFEVPILDLERLSPEIAKPRIDVELEQLDPGRVAAHWHKRTFGIGRAPFWFRARRTRVGYRPAAKGAPVKKPLALLALVAISVAISGCGGKSSPKAAPLPPSQPYSGNGVSLEFPKSWQQIDVTSLGSFDLTKWNYLATFAKSVPDSGQVAVLTVASSKTGASLKDVETSEIQTWGDAEATDYRTVAGVKATVITTKANSEEQSILAFFTKNGIVYEVKFGCKNENFSDEKGAIDLVLSSLKV